MARRPANTPEKRFLAFNDVRRWTRGVDIFAARCLVVPINWSLHWLLLFVVWLPREDADAPPEGCIFVLDSLGGADERFAQAMRVYLNHEWEARRRALAVGKPWPMPGLQSRVRVEEEDKSEDDDDDDATTDGGDDDDDVVEIVPPPGPPRPIEDPFELSPEQEVFNDLPSFAIEVGCVPRRRGRAANPHHVRATQGPRQSDGVNCGLFVMRNVQELVAKIDAVARARDPEAIRDELADAFEALKRNFRTRDANAMRQSLKEKMDALHKEAKARKLV